MKVSQYRYKKDQLMLQIRSLEPVMEMLRSDKMGVQVANVRTSLRFSLPGRTNEWIRKLPVIVWGATFLRKDGKVQMKNYTGYILLEVNGLSGPEEAASIREEAAAMPQTLLAFIGLSGKSVKIVVPFTLPDGKLPRSREKAVLFHAAAYQLAVKHFQPQLSSMITLKEPSPERGTRVSYDTGLYYNPAAISIRMEQPIRVPEESELRIVQEVPLDPIERLLPGVKRNTQIATLFSIVLLEAVRKFAGKESDDLHALFTEMAQNSCRLGIPEEEAVGWTLRYEALKSHELLVRQVFRGVYLLKKAIGGKLPLPECLSMVMQLDEFMARRYFFRMNEMSGEVEYLDRSVIQFAYRPYTQKVRNSICLEAQKEGLNVWDKDIDRYVYSDQIPLFHPIDAFLANLPVWDGKSHIREMAARVPNNNPLWSDCFYRWFLSMVAHWMQLDKEHGNSTTPLLVGDQGCGKSTYCLNLLPPSLRPFYTDSIDFGNKKEAELALHRYALINIDEFDSVKASHQSFLKHVLQKAVVNARLPYQSTTRSLRRYATFIATSNNFDLLTDPTGSRRFICVEVEGLIDYLQPVDYEQLYAEAKEMLRRGERYWFTHEEETAIVENNWRFQQIPAEEQLFLRYFCISEDTEGIEPLLASEILDIIAEKQPGFVITKKMILNFGKLLKRNNVPNKRMTRGTCYYVKVVCG